jgi:DNA-binding NtrC family response regulator
MITDLFMPGFSGSVLARKLAPFRPETKVLYASGYDGDSMVQLGVRGQDYAFLEKPFTRDALLRTVRELLDSPLLPLPHPALSPAPPLSRSDGME